MNPFSIGDPYKPRKILNCARLIGSELVRSRRVNILSDSQGFIRVENYVTDTRLLYYKQEIFELFRIKRLKAMNCSLPFRAFMCHCELHYEGNNQDNAGEVPPAGTTAWAKALEATTLYYLGTTIQHSHPHLLAYQLRSI